MAVKIEHGSDRNRRADDGSGSFEDVPLTVVAALRHHRAMQGQ
jgi:hypothetical protein